MSNDLIKLTGDVRRKPTGADHDPLDLSVVRARLASKSGTPMWRSLEELAGTPAFERYVEEEFPDRAGILNVDRRSFLKLAGASLALAGVAGCGRQPEEKLVPYVKKPEQLTQGVPLTYASAQNFGGYARGVLVRSNEGRPTKIEGNPDHPASLGATDVWMQADVLQMYDPDRSQNVLNLGEESPYDAFVRAINLALKQQKTTRGAGLRILTETVTSPTLANQMRALLKKFPGAKWYRHDPVGSDNAREGARLAFGRSIETLYRFDRANVVVSLDSDFLLGEPTSVRYARDFSNRRRVRVGRAKMSRVWAIESTPGLIGTVADHRLPVRPSEVAVVARALASRLGVAGVAASDPPASVSVKWLDTLVKDLQDGANAGASIVVAGESQPPAVHALAQAINERLGNFGRTVQHIEPVAANAERGDDLAALKQEMDAGQVEMLVILGSNPAYTAPADLNFSQTLLAKGAGGQDRVPLRVHVGLYNDETAALCHWHVPESHWLEAWGDIRAHDGTVSIVQPLIAPLYDSRSHIEIVGALLGSVSSGYDAVRGFHQKQRRLKDADMEHFWQRTLNEGVVRGTQAAPLTLRVTGDVAGTPDELSASPTGDALEIVFRADPTVWDGRYANNAWLQEMNKPLSKIVWDNAALMSLDTATRLGLTNEDAVELTLGPNKVTAAVWIVPGQPDNVVTAHLGYGRTRAGNIGTATGFNAYALRTSEALHFASGLQVAKVGRWPGGLATTEFHHIIKPGDKTIDSTHDRDELVVHALLSEYPARFTKHEGEAEHDGEPSSPAETQPEAGFADASPATDASPRPEKRQPTLYPEFDYSEFNQWGMAIDMNTCIGCNACAVACQAENNIPIVGKREVQRGREMHWLRIDRYYKGDIGNPETYWQPLMCVHCEKAPCEPVCPVAATVHSHEGLNQMVYNRCIGTRYCSNNCPYKVRRFNFLKWTARFDEQPVLKLAQNPEVTIRGRGVMEKCSYCVQRINHARQTAKIANRPIRDGEVITACQQACPTQAIIFGDIADKTSLVYKTKTEPQNYLLLDELGTRPRTSHMAKLWNPHPDLTPANTSTETERPA